MVKSKKKKKNKETQLTSQPANQVMRLRKTHSKEKKKITMPNFQPTQC
jgi:hypothetical protein